MLCALPDCCEEFSAAERIAFVDTIHRLAAERGKNTGTWPLDADTKLVDAAAAIVGANLPRCFPRFFHHKYLPFVPAFAAKHLLPHHAEWLRQRLEAVYT